MISLYKIVGLITLLTFHGRRVWVYTPADYDAKQTYDLLVVFDGEQHIQNRLPEVLDSLHAHTVGVLIDNYSGAQRNSELGNSARFNALLADSLIPWVRSKYNNITHDPHRTIVMGSSAGGLAAASAAFAHPEIFGNVFSQSGAFWRGAEGSDDAPYEWLTEQFAKANKKDIRFVMDVGELENHNTLAGSGPNFLEATRRLHDVLEKKGYDVVYTEIPGGVHAPTTWGPRMPLGLTRLMTPEGIAAQSK